MVVWKIETDLSLLSCLAFSIHGEGKRRGPSFFPSGFKGERLLTQWKTVLVEYVPASPAEDEDGNPVDRNGQPTERVINITDFPSFYSGVFVCSKRASEMLLPTLEYEVEVLPISVAGYEDEYSLMNPIKVLDCLDETRTEFREMGLRGGNPWRRVERYAFDYAQLADTYLFKTPYSMFDTFATDPLKNIIETHGFTGLKFIPAEKQPHPVFRNGMFDVEYR
jgi:hypothetical protein